MEEEEEEVEMVVVVEVGDLNTRVQPELLSCVTVQRTYGMNVELNFLKRDTRLKPLLSAGYWNRFHQCGPDAKYQ